MHNFYGFGDLQSRNLPGFSFHYSTRKAMATSPSSQPLSPARLAFLPKNKHDHASLCYLRTLPATSIQPVIPEFLPWLEDVNWPLSIPVAKLLLQNPELVIEPLRGVFRCEQDDWKTNCLKYLVGRCHGVCKGELRAEMERI